MKGLLIALALVAAAAAGAPALAAPKTVTLSVSGMTCSLCPLTVKKALMKVDGVTKAEVDLERKEAVVDFDDAKTTVEALTKATGDAGFPSTTKK